MFARRGKRLSLLFFVMAISARIFTGAPEAQVNFAPLFHAHAESAHHDISSEFAVPGTEVSANAGAQTSPDKNKNHSLYKKYLSPEYFAISPIEIAVSKAPSGVAIAYQEFSIPGLTAIPLAHAPPTPSNSSHTSIHNQSLEFGIAGVKENTSSGEFGGI